MLKTELNIEKIMKDPANANNSVIIMANFGNVSQFTHRYTSLVNRSYNYERKTGGHLLRIQLKFK